MPSGSDQIASQIFKTLPSCRRTMQAAAQASTASSKNPIPDDYTIWIYINRQTWKSSVLPKEVVLFYRKSETNGLFSNKVVTKTNLKNTHTSSLLAVIEVNTDECEEPALIVLLDDTRTTTFIITVANEIQEACSISTPLDNVTDRYYGLATTDIASTQADVNVLVPFETLMTHMLLSVAKHTQRLTVKSKSDVDSSTGVCKIKYYKGDDVNQRLMDAEEAFKDARDAVKEFGFFKYDSTKAAGLVVSLERIDLYYKSFKHVHNPSYCLLDDLYDQVHLFVIRYSNSIPGNYSKEETSVLYQRGRNVEEKLDLFLKLDKSFSNLERSDGNGELQFSEKLHYDIKNWTLKRAESPGKKDLSRADIQTLRRYVRGS